MRNGADTVRATLTLRPHEALALRLLSEAHGITGPEILRVGLRLLWRLHRQGKFRPAPRLVWRSSVHTTRRRRKP